jgi:uncharacterized protein
MRKQTIINSLEFAEKFAEAHGTIADLGLERLRDVLYDETAVLVYHLRGGVARPGEPLIELDLHGVLPLICQRCLGRLEFPLDSHARFGIVADELSLPAPIDEADDMEWLVADPHLCVESLVEEEVLLNLPLAPAHKDDDCAVTVYREPEKKENPFAVLRKLK